MVKREDAPRHAQRQRVGAIFTLLKILICGRSRGLASLERGNIVRRQCDLREARGLPSNTGADSLG